MLEKKKKNKQAKKKTLDGSPSVEGLSVISAAIGLYILNEGLSIET